MVKAYVLPKPFLFRIWIVEKKTNESALQKLLQKQTQKTNALDDEQLNKGIRRMAIISSKSLYSIPITE